MTTGRKWRHADADVERARSGTARTLIRRRVLLVARMLDDAGALLARRPLLILMAAL